MVKKYGSENVLIEHNFLKNIGGDGITPMYCFRPLVQYNVSENIALDMNGDVYKEPGDRQGMTAAAMWPWKCKTAVFQFNEAYSTFFNQDGEAWDADSGDGTIYQYNYSHDNAGGCIMFCEGESVNNIFRYNLSVNDGTGTITPVRNVDAHIYNNTFYIPEGAPFIRQGMSEGGILVEIIFSCTRETSQNRKTGIPRRRKRFTAVICIAIMSMFRRRMIRQSLRIQPRRLPALAGPPHDGENTCRIP